MENENTVDISKEDLLTVFKLKYRQINDSSLESHAEIRTELGYLYKDLRVFHPELPDYSDEQLALLDYTPVFNYFFTKPKKSRVYINLVEGGGKASRTRLNADTMYGNIITSAVNEAIKFYEEHGYPESYDDLMTFDLTPNQEIYMVDDYKWWRKPFPATMFITMGNIAMLRYTISNRPTT